VVFLVSVGGSDVARVLIGNQTDLESEREVSTEAGAKVAREIGCDFIECSAKQGTRVAQAFELLLRNIEKSSSASSSTNLQQSSPQPNDKLQSNPNNCSIL